MIANEMKKTPIHIYIVQETKVSECFDPSLVSAGNLYYETVEPVVSVDYQLRGVGLRNLNNNHPGHEAQGTNSLSHLTANSGLL